MQRADVYINVNYALPRHKRATQHHDGHLSPVGVLGGVRVSVETCPTSAKG